MSMLSLSSYLSVFHSATVAAGGNQTVFRPEDPQEVQTGRLFYRLSAGGSFCCSLLFSNVLDSTFADGSVSRANMYCSEWQLHAVRVAVVKDADPERVFDFCSLTFEGSPSRTVVTGDLFASDPIRLNASAGDYLCVECVFSGECIPCHEETILPTFVRGENGWIPSAHLPFPSMIGSDRKTDAVICFFGDSITQGIGTEKNSYAHWNACVSESLGDRYSYWNLGLGFARASDAASSGIWLAKAKCADIVTLCLGVNDLLQGASAQQVMRDLHRIVCELKQAGVALLIQSLPPFDYQGSLIDSWKQVNSYIRETLAPLCDACFDVVPILSENAKEPYRAKYGGHPNAEGCKAWAEALLPHLQRLVTERT